MSRLAFLLMILPSLMLIGGSRPVSAAQTLHLPFPASVKVEIIQGYNGGTHQGVERYSLDLVRADGGTNGSPVVAPASGTVAWAQPLGGQHGCIGVTMDDSADFHYMLCHIILNRPYNYGDRIQAGQSMGTVGAPGLVGNNGVSHIHMQLYTLPGGQRTPKPYAAPDGLLLEGVSMPADGTFNQWACSGASCDKRFVSANPATGPTVAAVADPAAALAAAGIGLIVGQSAVVAGTGDCLRVHAQPRMDAVSTGCVLDGTAVYLRDGPSQADGHTWWDLSTLGWVVADFLRPPATAGATPPPPPPVAVPPAASAAPQAAAPPAPPAESHQSAAPAAPPAPSTSLAVGVVAHVVGTGDCVRVHESASLDSSSVTCLADGVPVTIKDGPRTADGHDWWLLDLGGWVVGDYLTVPPGS